MSTAPIFRTPAGEEAIMAFYDHVLRRWPVPYRAFDVDTGYGRTFVIACGPENAPPLVLLHGAGSNSSMWVGEITEYVRAYRVYALDLPGEPGRSTPIRPEWDGPAYTEWLADALDALHLDRVTLVGLSQGGWTALKFAVAHPQRVEKLALLTPGGIVPDKASFLFHAIPSLMLGKTGTRHLLHVLYGEQPIPEGVEEAIDLINRNFRPRMGKLPIFFDTELQQLTMPTLLVIGDHDALRDGHAIAERLRGLLPQFEVAIIPGAGHALTHVAGRVMAFLQRDESGYPMVTPVDGAAVPG